jgi:DUF2958 family protein
MKLITKEILGLLPPLGGQENAADPIVYVKFFTPEGAWTWYVTEGSAEDDDVLMFGYVVAIVPEWGYFLLSELESVRGHLGLPIERDLWFDPTPVSEFLKPFPEQ